jgi:hypothetical protein
MWRGRDNGVRGKPSVARRGAAPPSCTLTAEKNSGSLDVAQPTAAAAPAAAAAAAAAAAPGPPKCDS